MCQICYSRLPWRERIKKQILVGARGQFSSFKYDQERLSKENSKPSEARDSAHESEINQSGLRASSFMLWTNCIVKLNAGNLNQRGKKILLETGGVS